MPNPAEPGAPTANPGTPDPSGSGPAPATLPRRLAAWLVDWVLCSVVVFGLLPYDLVLEAGAEPPLLLGIPQSSWAIVGVFALENVLLVSLTGSTVGHRLLGLQVWQVRPGRFPLQVVLRTLVLCLVLPAVVSARDGRGYHDVAAGTRIVRR